MTNFWTGSTQGQGQGQSQLAAVFKITRPIFRGASTPSRKETINFLTSKVRYEGQGHIKGQNNIFGHNFGSICRADFQLVSYCSLWKGKYIFDIQGQR